MHTKTILAVPLSGLFASLLSACPGQPACSDPVEFEIELTPEQYAQWQQGMNPELPGAPTTSAGESSSSSSTDGTGDTTGGTDGTDGTTDGTTGGGTGGGSTGELSEDEVCAAVCAAQFGPDVTSCSTDEQADKVVVTCNFIDQCIGGRGHACVRPLGVAVGPDAGGAWLARIAHDEAASVHAFRALAHELAMLGAPARLLAQIEAAAIDEVRHAAVMSSLARSRGAEPVPPACVSLPARSLLEIAIENAVEGCVHETWAALSAAHQARRAAVPSIRAVFAGIADDEARHAELAWTIDAWLLDQLDAADRARVNAARRSAVRELAARLGTAADDPSLVELGVPQARAASHLWAALDEALWSAAA